MRTHPIRPRPTCVSDIRSGQGVIRSIWIPGHPGDGWRALEAKRLAPAIRLSLEAMPLNQLDEGSKLPTTGRGLETSVFR
jgi:hypothetical protein